MATTLPSAQDQYMLELINRGRQDPAAEADHYNIDLNEGLAQDTISTDAKQPLAFNLNLNTAANEHSQWMLDNNEFSHTGENGTQFWERMTNAGYQWFGAGENISFDSPLASGISDFTGLVEENHKDLFISPGHRENLMNASFEAIGVSSLQATTYIWNGTTYTDVVMTTQKFGRNNDGPFITGVAYTDAVTDDDFYTVGEGIGGITVTALDTENSANTFTTTTWDAGGYSLDVSPNATYDVTFSGDLDGDGQADDTATYQVTVGSENVKQDVVSDNLPPSTPTNNPPTAVEIDNDTIAENTSNNTVVGNLTTSDPDAGDTHTYQLLDDANGRFALDGDQIVVSDSSGLDFESNQNHNITVRTTDDGGESFDQQLTINVSDVDETPTEPDNFNTIYGSNNNDNLRGTVDNDAIYGEGGNDVLTGRKGDDLLNGDSGNDEINGGSGNDILNGGSGNDILNGGRGMDTLTGVDITSAQPGYNEIDILRGNADADLFILGDSSQVYYTGNGINDYARIDTFNSGQGDRIQLSGSIGDYTLGEDVSGLPGGTAIYNNDDLVGIVKNVRNMDLNSSDFSFV
ncbi:CAP domain-containing protein [Okeania sp. SIO1I7]|uniref:CAP domain-containing protein n=1 Tax=Okeania sp. SIO1I7 TaxID=2607772 RepID=UPI0013FBB302|nr:CAP domain-containing protein [Okeania sp. SIO1I7]NET29941.1 hemolysin [Okeania sp. SIO1I7]